MHPAKVVGEMGALAAGTLATRLSSIHCSCGLFPSPTISGELVSMAFLSHQSGAGFSAWWNIKGHPAGLHAIKARPQTLPYLNCVLELLVFSLQLLGFLQ